MRQYRKHDWSALLAEFEQSGLSQTEFCKQKDINLGYFCRKRNNLESKSSDSSTFAKVDVQNTPAEGFSLQVGRCRILCPNSMPLQSLATLVHTLA